MGGQNSKRHRQAITKAPALRPWRPKFMAQEEHVGGAVVALTCAVGNRIYTEPPSLISDMLGRCEAHFQGGAQPAPRSRRLCSMPPLYNITQLYPLRAPCLLSCLRNDSARWQKCGGRGGRIDGDAEPGRKAETKRRAPTRADL